jgi:deazaflavin-dependent oxidoreductase (nitroreductase family)
MWPWINRVLKLHTALYRTTRGVIGHRVPFGLGPPTLRLDHVGARTGTKRTAPLAYVPDGDRVVLVASKGGNDRNPAWFHNLQRHPDTTVQIGSERRTVHARVASPDERQRLWPMAVALNKGYATYQQKTSREIPLVILERRRTG